MGLLVGDHEEHNPYFPGNIRVELNESLLMDHKNTFFGSQLIK